EKRVQPFSKVGGALPRRVRLIMQVAYELAPVIAEIISAHCPGTRARDEFVHACVYGQWEDAHGNGRGHARRALAFARLPGDPPARVPPTSEAGSRFGTVPVAAEGNVSRRKPSQAPVCTRCRPARQ